MLLTGLAIGMALAAQECTASDQDAWLTASVPMSAPLRRVHNRQIVPVADDQIANAVRMLDQLPFVTMEVEDAARLTGLPKTGDSVVVEMLGHVDEDWEADGFASREAAMKDAMSLGGGKLTPMLMRAVFPTPSASVGAVWSGHRLFISAGGLGCAPYAKHPVVMWLEQMPWRISVSAAAIR